MSEFDFDQVFDEDYLYFYASFLPDERSDAEADLISRLLAIEPGMEVLEIGCGHGRLTNRLAGRGAKVTGLDAAPRFLEAARADAAERQVNVEYVVGDMRAIPWNERFDRAYSWFTTFGYFSDEENEQVLVEAFKALKPKGRLLIDIPYRDGVLATFREHSIFERDGDFMLDISRFDPVSARNLTERIVIRSGSVRRFHFFVRLYAFTEMREILSRIGFSTVEGLGAGGEELTRASRRLIVIAVK